MEQEHIALYRRFRPQTFDEMVDQKAPVTALKQSVISGKIGHAYLFCGQRGTGKTSIAKVFSRAINCLNPVNGNPCNECDVCKGILNGSLLDVIEMDAASNNGVDDIRKICDEVNFAPTKARYKVYIIDEVHMLSSGAFNALLKTLEEPPKHVVFLFATTETHKIPATILSRCQRYDFKRISDDSIVMRLRHICKEEKIEADVEALKLIASLSDGALRDSISLLDQVSGIVKNGRISVKDVEDVAGTVDRSFLFRMANTLIDGDIRELFELSDQLNASGRDRIRFLLDLAQYFRDLLVIRTVPDPRGLLPYSPETVKSMYQTANKVSADTLIGFISYISQTVSGLKWSPSIKTSFETALIRMCGRKSKLEPTPLVMPDFEKLQKKAAEETHAGSAPAAAAAAPAPETPAPAAETAEAPAEKESSSKETPSEENKGSAEPAKPEAAPESPSPDKAESAPEKKDEDKESAEKSGEDIKKPESLKVDENSETTDVVNIEIPEPEQDEIKSPFDKLSEMRKSFASKPEAKTEPDPEDKPMENQIDLFSAIPDPTKAPKEEKPAEAAASSETPSGSSTGSASASAPAKTPEPSGEAGSNRPLSSFFGDMSGSFLDLLDSSSKNDKAPEPAPEAVKEEKKEELHLGETSKTQLSHIFDSTGLIVNSGTDKAVREPVVPDQPMDEVGRWRALLDNPEQVNPNLKVMLSKADFRVMGNCGYIVFEDDMRSMVQTLIGNSEFKRLSGVIKSDFDNIAHVYACVEKQYRKAEAIEQEKIRNMRMQEIKDKAGEFGIATELHFGDD